MKVRISLDRAVESARHKDLVIGNFTTAAFLVAREMMAIQKNDMNSKSIFQARLI